MKTLKTTLCIISLLIATFAINSCKKDEVLLDQPENLAVEIDPESQKMVDHLVEGYGFSMESILNLPDELLVDGDISFPKADFWKNYGSGMEGAHKHYRVTTNLVTATNVVYVSFATGVPSAWRTAFINAINKWNSLNGKITFNYCNPTPFTDITCTFYPGVRVSYESLSPTYPSTTIAIAQYPLSSGQPGSFCKINSSFAGTLSVSQMLFAATHELGHTIGIRHTDSGVGTLINTANSSCNINTDPLSVMGPNVRSFSAFTTCDVAAFKKLYPR